MQFPFALQREEDDCLGQLKYIGSFSSPLPEEMIQYARDDTHYLLYIYDKVREALWERGNEQPTQLQIVWQRSRDICLKVKLQLVGLPGSEYGLTRASSPLPVSASVA